MSFVNEQRWTSLSFVTASWCVQDEMVRGKKILSADNAGLDNTDRRHFFADMSTCVEWILEVERREYQLCSFFRYIGAGFQNIPYG